MTHNPFKEGMKFAFIKAVDQAIIESNIEDLYAEKIESFQETRDCLFSDLNVDNVTSYDEFIEHIHEGTIVIYSAPVLDYNNRTAGIFGSWTRRYQHKLFGYILPLCAIVSVIFFSLYTSDWYNLFGVALVPFAQLVSGKMNPLRPVLFWLGVGFLIYGIFAASLGFVFHSVIFIILHFSFFVFRINYQKLLIESAIISEKALLLLAGLDMIHVYFRDKSTSNEYRVNIFKNHIRKGDSAMSETQLRAKRRIQEFKEKLRNDPDKVHRELEEFARQPKPLYREPGDGGIDG